MIHKFIVCVLVVLFNMDAILPQTNYEKNNKSYHLVYIDVSRSKERKDLTDRLIKLIDEIRTGKDDFLIYLSNGYKPEILHSHDIQNIHIQNLASSLQTLNTSSPVIMFDKDTILSIWDKNDIISIKNNGNLELKYKSIYLHFFISSELFRIQEIELIDRFLLIKNLTKKHIDPTKINIDLLFGRNDSEAFIERKNQLAKNNWTGYNYSFTPY